MSIDLTSIEMEGLNEASETSSATQNHENCESRATPNTHKWDSRILFGKIDKGDWDSAINYIQKEAESFKNIADAAKNESCKKLPNILQRACKHHDPKVATDLVKTIFGVCRIHNYKFEELAEFVNYCDDTDQSALHIALNNYNHEIVEELILHGADIKKIDTRKICDGLHKVMTNIFDKGLIVEKNNFDSSNEYPWKVKCDFSYIAGFDSGNDDEPYTETGLLSVVLKQKRFRRAEVLLHPLVQIFLHEKWKSLRNKIKFSIIIHIIWSFMATWYFTSCMDINSMYKQGSWCLRIFWLFAWLFALGKEIVELNFCPDLEFYVRQCENFGQWVLLMAMCFLQVLSLFNDISLVNTAVNWIVVIGILASLLLIQGQMAKFDCLAVYNYMLVKSFKNLAKFTLAFCPILLAFTYTFSILLPQVPEFETDWATIVKTLAMMTGEINYSQVSHPSEQPTLRHPYLTKFVFLLFIITVVISLQNLLISMTVNDVKELKDKCKTSHLASKLELVYILERFLAFVSTMHRRFQKRPRCFERYTLVSTKIGLHDDPDNQTNDAHVASHPESQFERQPDLYVDFRDLPKNIQKAIKDFKPAEIQQKIMH